MWVHPSPSQWTQLVVRRTSGHFWAWIETCPACLWETRALASLRSGPMSETPGPLRGVWFLTRVCLLPLVLGKNMHTSYSRKPSNPEYLQEEKEQRVLFRGPGPAFYREVDSERSRMKLSSMAACTYRVNKKHVKSSS